MGRKRNPVGCDLREQRETLPKAHREIWRENDCYTADRSDGCVFTGM